MSNIPTPNNTQIPNIIIDHWMPILTPAEFKVLIFICRKTFGWHKLSDKISLTQIEANTGLSDKGVRDSVEKLEKTHKILRVSRRKRPGRNYLNTYSLIIKKSPNSVLEEKDKSPNSVRGKPEVSSGTKETLTKETPSKQNNSHKSEIYDGTGKIKKEEVIKNKKNNVVSKESLGIARALKEYIEEWGGRLSKSSKIEKWAKDIDKIMRIDGYSRDEINDVVYWVACQKPNKNNFTWRTNILSGKSLRRNFDKLYNIMILEEGSK